MEILNNDVFGFLKPLIDVHTLGVSTISNLLRDCGYKVFVAADKENEALQHIHKLNNFSLIQRWIQDNNISCLGFSYRLDPIDGSDYFLSLYEHLVSSKMFVEEGGCLRFLFFAGLPEACRIVELKTNKKVIVFPGDETPLESLQKLGIPKDRISKNLVQNNEYDDEGRVITLEFENFYMITIYTPNAKRELDKAKYKVRDLNDIKRP